MILIQDSIRKDHSHFYRQKNKPKNLKSGLLLTKAT